METNEFIDIVPVCQAETMDAFCMQQKISKNSLKEILLDLRRRWFVLYGEDTREWI